MPPHHQAAPAPPPAPSPARPPQRKRKLQQLPEEEDEEATVALHGSGLAQAAPPSPTAHQRRRVGGADVRLMLPAPLALLRGIGMPPPLPPPPPAWEQPGCDPSQWALVPYSPPLLPSAAPAVAALANGALQQEQPQACSSQAAMQAAAPGERGDGAATAAAGHARFPCQCALPPIALPSS